MKFWIVAVAIMAATPAFSQGVDPETADGCKASPAHLQEAGLAGSMLGGMAQKGLGNKSKIKLPPGTGSTLGFFVADRLACMLDSQERLQAEHATMQAVDQGVGGQASWRSATHKGVQGTSSVVAETRETDGSLCRNVTDVIVVNGEESTVNKRLCRAAGATGFVLAS
jgi:surface antigen